MKSDSWVQVHDSKKNLSLRYIVCISEDWALFTDEQEAMFMDKQ